jgi:hypothetical protein
LRANTKLFGDSISVPVLEIKTRQIPQVSTFTGCGKWVCFVKKHFFRCRWRVSIAGLAGRKKMAHEPVNSFVIEVLWDEEAEVWVAESDVVPGLIAEADSRTHLIEKLAVLIPELLELNDVSTDAQKPLDITLRFRREAEQREERIRLPKAA